MPRFRPRNDRELSALPDTELVSYVRAADAAAEQGEIRRAIEVLVRRHDRNIRRRVRLKVPCDDRDDVVNEIYLSALASAFNGTSEGELHAWLHTIADRRIADYHRARERRQKHAPVVADADDPDLVAAHASLQTADHAALVAYRDAFDRTLATRSRVHQDAIRLWFNHDLPARRIAEQLELSENNVHAILSRFRRDARHALASDPDTDGGDRR